MPDQPLPASPDAKSQAAAPRRRFSILRAGARLPRGHRSPLVRGLVALTSSGALLAVAGLVAAAAIIPPIGARRTARENAQRELAAQLEPGEKVVATTFASQRRWTDMWRESFGIVVATDRRVLYVGAPPTPLLRPREDGPQELLVESYPYDAAFTLEPRDRRWVIGAGLVLRTPAGQVDFIIDPRDMGGALAVADSSAHARELKTVGFDAGNEASRTPPPPTQVYVPYVVKRGETLIQLARRFGTTPDVLKQLNQLQTDAIRSGQRLRVPAIDSSETPPAQR